MATAVIVTLGCRLNQADEALLAGRLAAAGYQLAPPRGGMVPDLVVVNTCTVTAAAALKSHQAVRVWRRRCPRAVVVAVGCGPQAEPARWADEQAADLVLDNLAKADLPALLAKFATPGQARDDRVAVSMSRRKEHHGKIFREKTMALFPRRTRAFLKIQEGCNGVCSYCLVPKARGPERSRDRDEVRAEFARLVAAGHREIVLTGTNICAWRQGNAGIAELTASLLGIPGDWRLRFGSLEPHPAVADLVGLMAAHPARICRFLHLPLQHGDDEILARMGRPGRSADFARFAHDAAARIPGIHLGTDLIVGFPGETETHFRRSLDLVASLPLANLHIFRFSPRPGTPATEFPGSVPTRLAQHWARDLAEVGKGLAAAFRERQVGKVLTVLPERRCGGDAVEGWSDNYLRVRIADARAIPLNTLVTVRIAEVGEPLGGMPIA
jgi:threonylcarbamoyladenosine tRNA methylthiotransferase MtaB